MSCYHPLTGYVLGINPETGKKILKVVGKDYDGKLASDPSAEKIAIPCGHCIGCRLKYSRIWADRCLAEASYYNDNIFLTLTYDDAHMPPPAILDNGEKSPISSLKKRDLQLFIKRLRRKLPDQKIRYFACGEYGSKSGRCHFHIILFNCRLDDMKLLVKNEREFRYYTSKTISDCWYPEEDKDKKPEDRSVNGFHIITRVNWSTCAYVARYVVKKQNGAGASIYDKYKIAPEFTLMSRKPGIGRQYFEDHALDIYYDGSFLSTEDGAHRIYPNKYYDTLFDIEYPDCNYVIKEEAKEFVKINNELKSNLTSLSYVDMLKSSEENKIAQTKILKRKEI